MQRTVRWEIVDDTGWEIPTISLVKRPRSDSSRLSVSKDPLTSFRRILPWVSNMCRIGSTEPHLILMGLFPKTVQESFTVEPTLHLFSLREPEKYGGTKKEKSKVRKKHQT